MSLASGRHYVAIPGPSVMPDRVLQAMHRAAPNIYGAGIAEMTRGLMPDLRQIAGTAHQVAVYIANGHGVWEASISNTQSPGERVLVLNSGRFAEGWAEVARRLGCEVEIIDFGMRAPVDAARVAEALRADRGDEIRAVLAVHVDTASSVRNDLAAIRAAIDAAGHPALFMADWMASLGCERFEMDALCIDVMTAGSQKGLMTPPGLGFVFFNGRAAEARGRASAVSPYWDWGPRADPQEYYQTFYGTAPTHHLFGLRQALDMILEEGLEAVWDRHARLARAIWAAAEVWGAGDGALRLNIENRAHRSHAVTALGLDDGKGTELRDWLTARAGVTLGVGLGMVPDDDPHWHRYFRIGHMGHVNSHMVMGVLGTIDAGLKALGIAHGAGAVEAAATEIAGM